jgi:hypothetical protein
MRFEVVTMLAVRIGRLPLGEASWIDTRLRTICRKLLDVFRTDFEDSPCLREVDKATRSCSPQDLDLNIT